MRWRAELRPFAPAQVALAQVALGLLGALVGGVQAGSLAGTHDTLPAAHDTLPAAHDTVPATHDTVPATLAAIRQNSAQVTALVAQGKLLRIQRDFDCLNAPDSLRVIWKDSGGHVRKYMASGGSSDSAVSVSQYYGQGGRLSFALVEAGAVNGTNLEIRLYYGPAGNLLKQEDRLVRGPGYPFGLLERNVMQFPEVAFGMPSPC